MNAFKRIIILKIDFINWFDNNTSNKPMCDAMTDGHQH